MGYHHLGINLINPLLSHLLGATRKDEPSLCVVEVLLARGPRTVLDVFEEPTLDTREELLVQD